MPRTRSAAGPTLFYGWWVALALSAIVSLSSGIRFTIGPFLKPVAADGGFMPLVGRLVDRVGSRLVCSVGAVVMAASLVLTGWMTTLWEFSRYYAVAGVLLLVAAGLSLSIDEAARPACRAVPLPSRPHPVAGGR